MPTVTSEDQARNGTAGMPASTTPGWFDDANDKTESHPYFWTVPNGGPQYHRMPLTVNARGEVKPLPVKLSLGTIVLGVFLGNLLTALLCGVIYLINHPGAM